jgi:hypothetical protein
VKDDKFSFAVMLVPIALVIGTASGIAIATGKFPARFASQAIGMVVGAWIGILVLGLLLDVVQAALIFPDENTSNEGAQGELTILLIRDGQVVGELHSWDKLINRQKRNYWAKKLGRLLPSWIYHKEPETE